MPANNRPLQYSEFIRIRISKEHFLKLTALCDYNKTSMSKEVRKAIEQYLQNVYGVALPIENQLKHNS